MKRKRLKSLKLHKYSVSNLTLLHRKIGGMFPSNTDGQTYIEINDASIEGPTCSVVDHSGSPECPSMRIDNCQTNAGTTKVKPPSEHEGCQANGGYGSIHQGIG
ncbi:hypothetical protein [uncultured Kordia sp.]|uniref:hypothetical protein n=1 Tax=uncultured Kordia sp. TaxID=507699 RepID=UPI002601B5A2|nr:hypothetical protein [uncultured Kordia sp.]